MSTKYRNTIRVPESTRGYGENKRVLPALDVKLETSIDWTALFARFGEKAARSKGRKTSMLNGLIKIKVVSSKEVAR